MPLSYVTSEQRSCIQLKKGMPGEADVDRYRHRLYMFNHQPHHHHSTSFAHQFTISLALFVFAHLTLFFL